MSSKIFQQIQVNSRRTFERFRQNTRTFFDSPPPKVAETYKRIDVDSCKFLFEVSAQIRDRQGQVSLNQSRVE